MEVGRVGDLRIRDGSIVRLPLVGDRLYECHDQKKDLTGAGLLMEVARDPLKTGLAREHHAVGLGRAAPAVWPGAVAEVEARASVLIVKGFIHRDRTGSGVKV